MVATKVAKYISNNEDKRQVCMKDISVNAIVNVLSALELLSGNSKRVLEQLCGKQRCMKRKHLVYLIILDYQLRKQSVN